MFPSASVAASAPLSQVEADFPPLRNLLLTKGLQLIYGNLGGLGLGLGQARSALAGVAVNACGRVPPAQTRLTALRGGSVSSVLYHCSALCAEASESPPGSTDNGDVPT